MRKMLTSPFPNFLLHGMKICVTYPIFYYFCLVDTKSSVNGALLSHIYTYILPNITHYTIYIDMLYLYFVTYFIFCMHVYNFFQSNSHKIRFRSSTSKIPSSIHVVTHVADVTRTSDLLILIRGKMSYYQLRCASSLKLRI